jgi:cytochrome P450
VASSPLNLAGVGLSPIIGGLGTPPDPPAAVEPRVTLLEEIRMSPKRIVPPTGDIEDPVAVAERIFVRLIRPRGTADPYPHYARIRELAPVLRVHLPATLGGYVLVRYADCLRLLREPHFHSLGGRHLDALLPHWRESRLMRCFYRSLGFRNDASHGVLRRAFGRYLTGARARALAEDIAAVADRLLDRMADRGSRGGAVDLVTEFALPLSATVIGRVLGLPDEVAVRLGRATRPTGAALELVTSPQQHAAMEESAAEVLGTLEEWARERMRRPREDLLSTIVTQHGPHGGRPHWEELLGNLYLLFAAGFDSPVSLVGLGTKALLDHPHQAAALRATPWAAATAVEEILRYDSPFQLAVRIATEPSRFGDVDIAPGTPILGLLGAANRDPAHVAEADRFDIARQPVPLLSFGAGAHYCLGAALARTQARVLFPRLLRRFPRMTLAGPPVYRSPGLTLRGIERLPVGLSGPAQVGRR